MKITSNAVFTTLATLAIAAGAYWYFFAGTEQPALLTSSAEMSQAQMRFQTLVGELQPISFNVDIFSDPRFDALIDITVPVSPESAGRLDPFAPITSISGK